MKKKIHTQRVIRVGNSLAVTLDHEFVKEYGLKATQQVYVLYTKNPPKIVVKPDLTEGLTFTEKDIQKLPKEFQAWVKKFIEEDRESLQALAKF